MNFDKNILALSGGVGGAKLALGLSKLLAPEQQQQAHPVIDHGYGGSAYGGNEEGKPTKL